MFASSLKTMAHRLRVRYASTIHSYTSQTRGLPSFGLVEHKEKTQSEQQQQNRIETKTQRVKIRRDENHKI